MWLCFSLLNPLVASPYPPPQAATRVGLSKVKGRLRQRRQRRSLKHLIAKRLLKITNGPQRGNRLKPQEPDTEMLEPMVPYPYDDIPTEMRCVAPPALLISVLAARVPRRSHPCSKRKQKNKRPASSPLPQPWLTVARGPLPSYPPPSNRLTLHSLKMFGHFNEQIFGSIYKSAEFLDLSAKQILFKIHDADDSFYIVQRGRSLEAPDP